MLGDMTTAARRVCVTGATGKAGRAAVQELRKWNVWGYVDVRDVAAACRPGLEAEVTGSQNVIIAAAEFGTLLAIDRARDLLGYEPAHSWRDHM
jgi:hypothetical protein